MKIYTADREISVFWEAEKMYKLFKEKFPENEGYKIDVTKWETIGKSVDIET